MCRTDQHAAPNTKKFSFSLEYSLPADTACNPSLFSELTIDGHYLLREKHGCYLRFALLLFVFAALLTTM